MRGVFGAVDVERFAPRPVDPEFRHSLGLTPQHLVIGIVARIQRHRRFDLLLEAVQKAPFKGDILKETKPVVSINSDRMAKPE